MGNIEPIDPRLDEVASKVVDAAFKVHTTLGPGLLEQIYEASLAKELTNRGLRVMRQVEVPVVYDGEDLGIGLRLDMLVEDGLIIEIKAVENAQPVYLAQLLTYLKLTGHRLGLLINFNVRYIKDGVQRVVL